MLHLLALMAKKKRLCIFVPFASSCEKKSLCIFRTLCSLHETVLLQGGFSLKLLFPKHKRSCRGTLWQPSLCIGNTNQKRRLPVPGGMGGRSDSFGTSFVTLKNIRAEIIQFE